MPDHGSDGMARTIFIHIGLHKTGSTAIQVAFDGYAGEKLVYPHLGDANQSTALVNAFTQTPETYRQNVLLGHDRQTIDTIRSTTRKTLFSHLKKDQRDILLSGEGLVHLSPEDIAGLRDALSPHTDQFKIIVFVRDPVAVGNSAFAERMKHGQFAFQIPQPKFRPAIEKYQIAFGHEAVQAVHLTPGVDSVAAISAIMGIDPPPKPKMTANPTLSLPACRIFFSVNTLLSEYEPPQRRAMARKLLKHASDFEGPRLAFSPDLLRDHLNHEDIQWLDENFGITFDVETTLAKIDTATAVTSENDLAMTGEDRQRLASVLNLAEASDAAILRAADKVLYESRFNKLRTAVKSALKRPFSST